MPGDPQSVQLGKAKTAYELWSHTQTKGFMNHWFSAPCQPHWSLLLQSTHRGGMTFQVRAEFTQVEQISCGEKASLSPGSVENWGSMTFGQDEAVVAGSAWLLEGVLHGLEEQHRHQLCCRCTWCWVSGDKERWSELVSSCDDPRNEWLNWIERDTSEWETEWMTELNREVTPQNERQSEWLNWIER